MLSHNAINAQPISHSVNVKLWIVQDANGNSVDPTESKSYCETVYNPLGIDFNCCGEILVDQSLFDDPTLFNKPNTNCNIDLEPNYVDVYLVAESPET